MAAARRLAILSTHPIQYHSGWFRGLAAHPDLQVHVYYCHRATPQEQASAGFGVVFDWDVPLLTGYPHSFLQNIARPAGHGRFAGFVTPEIGKIIRELHYDAVLVNGWHYKSAWQAIWAAWRAGIKVLVRGDSHLHGRRSAPKRLLKLVAYRRFIPRFDACLAVGQWSREYFLHYGASPERIFLVPHIVDFDRLEFGGELAQANRRRFREALSLDENAITFAFCGKFMHKKRPMDFVRAVERASKQGATLQGLMVGDGPLRSVCEGFVRANGVPIRFSGFLNQSKIWEAYLASDALVLPSEETWGVVVNEAMACGRPCIVSDHVGCGPDLIRPGTTGETYPLGDVEMLTAIMKDFATDPVRLAGMGQWAKLMAEKYSVQAAVDGVLQSLAVTVGPAEPLCAH